MRRILYLGYFIKNSDYPRLMEFARHAHAEGYSYFYIWFSMIYCALKYMSGFDEFFIFRFYSKNAKERSEWACSGYMYEYQLKMNPREYRDILDDKTKFYKYYGQYMVHSVGDISDLEHNHEVLSKIYNSPTGKMVFKARDGQCGNSVLVCNTSEMKMDEIIPFMRKNKWDLLEEYVVQHKDITKLSPFAVNTIRVVTQINKDGNVDILACRMRISGGASVDNFSHKSHTGMAAAINAETGVIDRPAVKKDNFSEPISIHPKTGVSIVGFQVPYWKEVLELTKNAALSQPQNKSIGWDVVITDNGPGLIEGNHNWNRDIFQMPVNKGLKSILEDYKCGRK